MSTKQYVWEDRTSYSQSDKERVPTTWEIHFPGFRMSVWKSRYEGVGYQYSLYGKLLIEGSSLEATTGREARRESLAAAKRHISELYEGVFRKSLNIKDFEDK